MSEQSPKNARRSYRLGYAKGLAAALAVAQKREAVCADAVEQVKAGKLYPDLPTAYATENCARLEASEIVRQIAALSPPPSGASS